jgi:hypothetical protein
MSQSPLVGSEGKFEQSLWKSRADLLDSPNGATLIHLALFADEGGGNAFQNPNVIVGWLFTNHWGDQPGKATEFSMQHVVDGVAGLAADVEGNRTGRLYGNGDQPWLRGWSDE